MRSEAGVLKGGVVAYVISDWTEKAGPDVVYMKIVHLTVLKLGFNICIGISIEKPNRVFKGLTRPKHKIWVCLGEVNALRVGNCQFAARREYFPLHYTKIAFVL